MKKTLLLLLSAFCINANAQQTEVQYLSGTDADNTVKWDFKCSEGMQSGKWRKIAVPSCWEMQGFGEYTYGRYYLKKGVEVSDETGHYRHTFKVPADWKDKKVEIVFEGVMTDTRVIVNGQQVGDEHQGGFTAFSYDITKLINFDKKNKLEVFVEKQSKDKSVNASERRADWWLFGGIYRPVYLRALPKTNISHIAVDARADGKLSVDVTTEGDINGYKIETNIIGLGKQVASLGSSDNSIVNNPSSNSSSIVAPPSEGVGKFLSTRQLVNSSTNNLIYLNITATDSKGRIVPEYNEPLTATVEGGATLYALDNHDHYTSELFHNVNTKNMKNGRMQVILRRSNKPGKIVLKVATPSFKKKITIL